MKYFLQKREAEQPQLDRLALDRLEFAK